MAASVLKAFVAGGADTPLWLGFEDYARQVFAGGGGADWYRDAARYAGTLMQAQGALASDIIEIDIVAPLLAGVASAEAAAVVDSLGEANGAAFVDQALEALLHRYGGKCDIVLALPAPGDLLGDAAASFDDLDDVATALAALLRRHADKAIAGIVLDKRAGSAFEVDEVDACEPLFSAARHYQWATALRFAACGDGCFDAGGLDADIVLLPASPLAVLDGAATAPRLGGGLTAAFFAGSEPIAADCASGLLLHGSIPPRAEPETVLSVLRTLRG